MKSLYQRIFIIFFSFLNILGTTAFSNPNDIEPNSIVPLPFYKYPFKDFPKIPLKAIEGEIYVQNPATQTFEVAKINVLDKKLTQLVAFDPVKFSINAETEEVNLNKEIEIKITAEYLDIHPQMMFVLDDSYEFTLKMLLPKGFVITGGSYYDYMKGKVSKEVPRVSYTIKGYFEEITPSAEFKLLRSNVEASASDYFVVKASLSLQQGNGKDIYYLSKPESKNRIAEITDTCFDSFDVAVSTSATGGCQLVDGETLNFNAIFCPSPAQITWFKANTTNASNPIQIGQGTPFSYNFDINNRYYFATCSTASCTKKSKELGLIFLVLNSPDGNPTGNIITQNFCPQQFGTILTASCAPGVAKWNDSIVGNIINVTSAPTAYSVKCERTGCTSNPIYDLQTTYNIIENCAGGGGTNCNGLPTPPTISADKTVIATNQQAIITATGCNGVVTWSNQAQGASITVNPTQITNYTAICSENGCVSSNSNVVTIIPCSLFKPNLQVVSTTNIGGSGVCSDQKSVTFSASSCPSGELLWQATNSDNGQLIYQRSYQWNNPSIIVSENTTFKVRCFNSSTCESLWSDPINISASGPPIPSVEIGGTTVFPSSTVFNGTGWDWTTWNGGILPTISVCSGFGSIVNVKATGCPSGIYKWTVMQYGGAGYSTDGTQNIVLNYQSPMNVSVACRSNSPDNCYSTAYQFIIKYNSTPFTPVLTSNTQSICGTGSADLELGTGQNSAFRYLFYDSNNNLIANREAGNATVRVYPTQTTSYYVVQRTIDGLCSSAPSNIRKIYVSSTNATNQTITTTKSSICQNESFTLSSSNCDGQINWQWVTVGGAAGSQNTDGDLVVNNLTQTTTYKARCTNGCSTSLNWSNEITINVSSVVISPPTISASKTTLNYVTSSTFDSSTLTATGCTSTVVWSNGKEGNSIVENTLGNYTAKCKENNCESGNSNTIELVACPQPKPTSTNAPLTVNPCGVINVTAQGCPDLFYWSAPDQGYATGTGDVFSYEIKQPTTFSVRCLSGGCLGEPLNFTVGVNGAFPTKPTNTSPQNAEMCSGTSFELTATGCNGVYAWYTVPYGGVPVGYGQTFTTPIHFVAEGQENFDISYYVRCKLSETDNCDNPADYSTFIRFVRKPNALVLSPSTADVCLGQGVVLSPSNCPSNTIVWKEGNTESFWYNPPERFFAPQQTTAYSVSCSSLYGAKGCMSDASNIVFVHVSNTSPNTLTISSTKTALCGENDSVVLSSSSCDGTIQWQWTNAGGSNTQTTVGDLTVFNLTQPTTYKVMCINGCGTSPNWSNEITIGIGAAVSTPVISTSRTTVASHIPTWASTTITASNCSGNVMWSNGMNGNSISVTTNSELTITASCQSGACVSGQSNTIIIKNCTEVKPTLSYTFEPTSDSQGNPLPAGYCKYIDISFVGCPSGNINFWIEKPDGTIINKFDNYSQSNHYRGWVTQNTIYKAKCSDFFGYSCDSPWSTPLLIESNGPGNAVVTASKEIASNLGGGTSLIESCIGEVVNFTANGCSAGANYIWRDAVTTNTIGTGQNFSFSSNQATNKTIVALCSDGTCLSAYSNIFQINVITKPTPPVLTSANTNICPGGSTKIEFLNNNYSYTKVEWSNGEVKFPDYDFASGTYKHSLTVSPTQATNYSASIFSRPNGCKSDLSNELTINITSTPFELIATNNSNPVFLTEGQTLNLNATSTEANLTFSWVGPNNFVSNLANPTISNSTLLANGIYTVTATAPSGCIVTATTNVVIVKANCQSPPNNIEVNANKTVVPFGGQVVLTAQSCSGIVLWTADAVYAQGGSTITKQTTFFNTPINGISTVNVSPIGNEPMTNGPRTLYTAQCMIDGCLSEVQASSQVYVKLTNYPCLPPDKIDITGGNNRTESIDQTSFIKQINVEVCPNESFTLNAYGCSNVLTWADTWATGNSFATGVSRTVQASNMQADVVNYTAICPADNCPSEQIRTVIRVERKSFAITATSNSTSGQIQIGGDVNFTVSTAEPNVTYTWTGPNNFASNLANPTITAATADANGIYTVEVTNATGCIAKETAKVELGTCDSLAVTADNNSKNGEIAIGGTVILNAISTIPNLTYTWSGPNNFASNLQNPQIVASSYEIKGFYNLTVTNSNGCTSNVFTEVKLKEDTLTCNLKIVSYDLSKNIETDTLSRAISNNQLFNPIRLTIVSTDSTSLNGANYFWKFPSDTVSSTNDTLIINYPGKYKVFVFRGGTVCSLEIDIRAKACNPPTANYSYCTSITPPIRNETHLLPLLVKGDIFYAADYPVLVTNALKVGDRWTGTGEVKMTLIGGVKVDVEVNFNAIKINSCYELVDGSVFTTYDPNWNNVISLDEEGAVVELFKLLDALTDELYACNDPNEPQSTLTPERKVEILEQIEILKPKLLELPTELKDIVLPKIEIIKTEVSKPTPDPVVIKDEKEDIVEEVKKPIIKSQKLAYWDESNAKRIAYDNEILYIVRKKKVTDDRKVWFKLKTNPPKYNYAQPPVWTTQAVSHEKIEPKLIKTTHNQWPNPLIRNENTLLTTSVLANSITKYGRVMLFNIDNLEIEPVFIKELKFFTTKINEVNKRIEDFLKGKSLPIEVKFGANAFGKISEKKEEIKDNRHMNIVTEQEGGIEGFGTIEYKLVEFKPSKLGLPSGFDAYGGFKVSVEGELKGQLKFTFKEEKNYETNVKTEFGPDISGNIVANGKFGANVFIGSPDNYVLPYAGLSGKAEFELFKIESTYSQGCIYGGLSGFGPAKLVVSGAVKGFGLQGQYNYDFDLIDEPLLGSSKKYRLIDIKKQGCPSEL